MIIETRPRLAELLRKLFAAGRQHKDAVGFVDRLVYNERGDIRSDILRAVILLLEYMRDTPVLPGRHLDVAVSFVVLEENIIFWRVLLDQAAFKHKRLELAVRYDGVKIVYMADHFVHLGMVLFHRAEIAADPVFQRLGLADINNLAAFVLHDVDARQKRKPARLFGQKRKTRIVDCVHLPSKLAGQALKKRAAGRAPVRMSPKSAGND